MKKKQEAPISAWCEEVMALGNEHRYRPLQVNSSLMIGSGPHGWHAYAVLATKARIEQIKQAMRRAG
jgi:hypothetical protein